MDQKPKTESKFYPELESLRGLAALLVMLYHLPAWIPGYESLPVISHGYLMVDLFFVLSGFVIALHYHDRIRNSAQFFYFMKLRWIRLYPVHFVFLVLFLLLECAKWVAHRHGMGGAEFQAFSQNGWTGLVQHFFLVQGLGIFPGGAGTFNGPSWSISTEFYTYALFAAAGLMMNRRPAAFVLALLALGAILFNGAWGGWIGQYEEFLRCIYGFFVGVLAFEFRQLGAKIAAHQLVRWLVPLLILALLASPVRVDTGVAIIVPLSGLMIWCLLQSHSRALNLPPVKWLGVVSYSLYMSHDLVIWIVTQATHFIFKSLVGIQALVAYALTIGLALLVAKLTFEILERPSLLAVKRRKTGYPRF